MSDAAAGSGDNDGAGGRAVLITGASRGIGRATAIAFAAQGDRVAVHHRDSPDQVEAVLAELAGSGHVAVRADFADADEVMEMVDAAALALGGLDVLVNNAGRYTPHRITEVSYVEWQQQWRRTLDINLVGAANACYCAVRHMKPGSAIVNVSSRGAFRGEPGQPAYGASKAGLNALGQSLAKSLAPLGIQVATVAPGFVQTEMASTRLNSAEGPAILAESPFNRVARPEEVAAAIVWLASPQAQWATGSVLDLNGASYLRT